MTPDEIQRRLDAAMDRHAQRIADASQPVNAQDDTGKPVIRRTGLVGQVGQYKEVVLEDGPAGYWQQRVPANGGPMVDSSGHGLDGTYAAAGVATGNGPLAGTGYIAANLDGVAGYGTVPHNALLNATTALTIEAWVYPLDRLNYYMIVTKQPDPPSGNAFGGNYSFRVNITSGLLAFDWESPVGTNLGVTSASAIIPNVYSHVAVTFDGATVRFYINGVLDAAIPWAGTLIPNTQTLLVGNRKDNLYYFKGVIGEVAVYQSVLSPTQIAAHYTEGMQARLLSVTVGGTTFPKVPVLDGATRFVDSDPVLVDFVNQSPLVLGKVGTGTRWETPILLNSWANFGGGFMPAGYRRIGAQVILRGLVSGGSSLTAVICTLPVGYRPPYEVILSGSSNDQWAELRINQAGSVWCSASPAGSVAWVSLDGSSFFVD